MPRPLTRLAPVFLIAALIALVAAVGVFAVTGAKITSGIKGEVVIAPVCPVEKVAVACPDFLGIAIHTKVTAGGKTVYTDDHGGFRIPLKPGVYTLTAYGGIHRKVSRLVRVQPHRYTAVRLNIDSGIR